jgi:hypothetical protein
MAAIPIPVVIPIAVVVVIIPMPVLGTAIITTVFFDFTPGCCHQQTGQAE